MPLLAFLAHDHNIQVTCLKKRAKLSKGLQFLIHFIAVLVNNASLFILFGTDVSAKPVNQLLVLNVRDENNITFANNFVFESPAVANNPSSNPDSSDPPSTLGSVLEDRKKGLSKGSIAGIVVGCIIAVCIFFYNNYLEFFLLTHDL